MAHTTASTTPIVAYTPRTRGGPILAAVGGSDPASAVHAARLLASHSPRGVLAVGVVEPLLPYMSGEPDGVALPPEFEDQEKSARLDQLGAQILETAGPQPAWSVEVTMGDAAHAIAQSAYAHGSPLIVMGLGRHRRIDRFLGLETTLRTVHRARCPVLAVTREFELPRRVVIATDFTPVSARAAEAVMPLLDSAASITLLHVWQRAAESDLDSQLNEADARYAASLPGRFARLAELLATSSGTKVSFETREGEVSAEVLRYAAAEAADLIVAGRRGFGSLQRMLSHSITADLLRGSRCSVFIAPEPQYADIDRLRVRLAGVSESQHPAEWSVQLDSFTRRNHGRRVALEEDDPQLGAQLQTRGHALLGATYDPHDRRVELMLGSASGGNPHFTRGITAVWSIGVIGGEHGRDTGLRIAHGEGQTLLSFVEDDRGAIGI